MKRLGLCLLCMVCLASTGWAQTPAELAASARAAYDRGDYVAAITAYTALRTSGCESAELDYNLGNAEFKAGHIGRAISQYRRALARAPQDEDIRYNLDFARTYVKQPADRSGLLTRLFGNLLTLVTESTMALTALILFWLLCACAGALLLTRGGPSALRWTAAVAGLLFVVAATWASARLLLDRSHRWGVIVAAQASAHNGPSEDYQVGFVVPEGREVRVLGREGTWVAVGLPSEGYKGWVRSEDVQTDE